MKKLLSLALLISLVFAFSVMVAANNPTPGEDDPDWTYGEGIYADYDPFASFFDSYKELDAKWKTITNARTICSPKDVDYEQGDQEASVTIKTKVNIPCYLEMELIGNAGYSKVKSVGAHAKGNLDRTTEPHWMFFDSNVGGFLNQNWESIDRETFCEIAPNRDGRDPVYLQACDMWTAHLYANIDYAFDVTATPLVNSDDATQFLNMDMRHTMDGEAGWTEHLALGNTTVGTFPSREENTVYMQFRVPYSADVDAGQYDGTVTFKIYSI